MPCCKGNNIVYAIQQKFLLLLYAIENHMKNQYYLILMFCALLSACSLPPTYMGDKLPPTHKVDVYYSANEVKRDYKVIGNLLSHVYIKSAIEHNMTAFAKKEGGDGVIIMPEANNRIEAEVIRYK